MARSFGIKSRPARQQLQAKQRPSANPEPLPDPYRPGPVGPGDLGIQDAAAGISFFALGDVGGIKEAGPQNAVSVAMQRALGEGSRAAFALLLGDVVYFNGQQMSVVEGRQTGYGDQFYEAYAGLARPIIAFPGNHDGEQEEQALREQAGLSVEASLQGFMENFCSPRPEAPKDDPHLEYKRHTQTLPYCEWTLELATATIVAIYTNVPSGGHLEPQQIQRLESELKRADPAKRLILGLHHPPYSVDQHHGGSQRMVEVLDQAFAAAERVPDLVLSGHVHDYQRFSRVINGKTVPFIVAGNGGYHNKHLLAKDATPGEELAEGVTFEYGDDRRFGFLTLTITPTGGTATYTAVEPGRIPDGTDAQIYPAEDSFSF